LRLTMCLSIVYTYKPVRQWFGFPYSQSHKPRGSGLTSDSQSHKRILAKENGEGI